MADEIKQTFEDLTNKRCRTCAVCGKPENDGLLFDDSAWICNVIFVQLDIKRRVNNSRMV